ncbi:MAG: choice-of-anchor Q domain-containing protein, partial [Actinomycetota bacterium]
MRVRTLIVAAICLVFGAAVLGALPAGALNTVTVDTTTDVVDGGDGLTSLREAISEAMTDADDTTIVLSAASTYTLDLCVGGADEDANVGGDLDYVSGEVLTIEVAGSGKATIEQTCANERVLEVDRVAPTTDLVTIRDVIFTGGDARSGSGAYCDQESGGAICNTLGSLTLERVELRDNFALTSGAGVASADGNAVVPGITLTIVDSTIADNSSGNSGTGVDVSRHGLDMTGSTVSGNTSGSGGGGGVYVHTTAAGGLNNPASISNSTISGNSANGPVGGGGVFADGVFLLNLTHTTIADNNAPNGPGDAIRTFGSDVRIAASVFASAADNCFGGVTSEGHNVALDATCGLTGTGDTESATPGQLALGALAANGGETDTALPGASSILLDVVPTASCAVTHDQRGVARPQPAGGNCDIGAVEVAPVLPAISVPDVTFVEDVAG